MATISLKRTNFKRAWLVGTMLFFSLFSCLSISLFCVCVQPLYSCLYFCSFIYNFLVIISYSFFFPQSQLPSTCMSQLQSFAKCDLYCYLLKHAFIYSSNLRGCWHIHIYLYIILCIFPEEYSAVYFIVVLYASCSLLNIWVLTSWFLCQVRVAEYNNIRSQLNAINRKQSGRQKRFR